MENIFFCIITVTFIVCIFLAWYFIHKSKHKERLMMIEKGITPDLPTLKKHSAKSYLLKIGVMVIGLSFGLVIISILGKFELINGNIIPLAILGICGGGSMVIANYIGNING